MTVARLRTEMSQAEFTEWVAYHAVQKEHHDSEQKRRNRKRR